MKARVLLICTFSLIFLTMLLVTAWASWCQAVWASKMFNEPWAVATFADAYCGFLTFFVWVAYKENSVWKSMLWFLLIMALGNIAMSGYVLWQLWGLRADEPFSKMLLRRGTT